MQTRLAGYWNILLRVGYNSKMDYGQQMRLFALNAFLFISIVLTLLFVITFVSLGSYTALQGLSVIPVLALILYLNSRGNLKLAGVLVIYGLLVLILILALLDRRTGTEYVLIALGCCSVMVFEKLIAIIIAFLSAFACYAFYAWYDATHPFVVDPNVPYILIQNSLMFLSGFGVVAQSLAFRALVNKYADSLSVANQEIKSVNEALKSSNEELLTFSENLDLLVKQKSAELQAYMDAINVNLYSATTDWQGNFIKVNTPLVEATGYSAQELVGQNFLMLNSEDHSQSEIDGLFETVHSHKTWRGEVKCKLKRGAYLWVDMVVMPVKAQNEASSYLLILALSISERKELEEKNRKAVSALESVAFRTSHEIKGPLARIIGLTNILDKGFFVNAEMPYITKQLTHSSSELDMATHDLTVFVNQYQGFSQEKKLIDNDQT